MCVWGCVLCSWPSCGPGKHGKVMGDRGETPPDDRSSPQNDESVKMTLKMRVYKENLKKSSGWPGLT